MPTALRKSQANTRLRPFKRTVEEVRDTLAGANLVIGLTTPSDTGSERLGRATARTDLVDDQRVQPKAENAEATGQGRKPAAQPGAYRV